ncbi:hypothetical protein F5144DRAFT_401742 [Chaetomium tenue]|uniref:Uncharacterized protein n=1 Tax=Chaetomium tenue TaxID=1854479 RepID=A0ACB7NWE5_9PEZI|nr:hypothetical protein F5144DRAFT_401742 [Chaetomium globosum]
MHTHLTLSLFSLYLFLSLSSIIIGIPVPYPYCNPSTRFNLHSCSRSAYPPILVLSVLFLSLFFITRLGGLRQEHGVLLCFELVLKFCEHTARRSICIFLSLCL